MENEQLTVPYIVHESAMARNERHIRRLVIALIVAIVMMVISNLAWLYMWNSYEYVGDSSISVEGEGNANYIGNDGDITNGESSSEKDQVSQEEEWSK
jgi:cell division septal protein FtsQ